jgi:hypothetical protein
MHRELSSHAPACRALLAACLALVIAAVPAAADARDQVRFMPVGNSITDGEGYPPGFRDDLNALLQGEPQHTFDWVGDTGTPPLVGHFQGGREIDDFYPSSYGNGWGNGTFDITAVMGPPDTPDLVAIHLGTNDLNSQLPPYAPYSLDHGQTLNPSQPGELAELLLYLLRWQSGPAAFELDDIVLSMIIPMEGRDQDVADFNSAVVAMAEDLAEGTVTGSPVRIALADHYDHFLSNPDLFTYGPGDWMEDNLHPNDVGYTEMAIVYHAAIIGMLDDTVAPADVTDLAVAEVDTTRVVLAFTAPGDDFLTGQAARYDLRVSFTPIDAASFATATQITGEPLPATGGSIESIEVTGLLPGNTYYFALKASDEGGNRAPISNVVSVATQGTPTVTLTLREGLNGYFGSEDNTMIDGRPSDNWGGNDWIAVGKIGTVAGAAPAGEEAGGEEALVNDVMRSLVRFDLTQVPAHATVLEATLELYNTVSESSGPDDVSVYRVTKRWVEGTRTGPPSPQSGTSCWISARLDELDWSSPGASAASDDAQNDDPDYDRLATPEDTVTLSGAASWYTWDVTEAVSRWVSGEWNNEGLVVIADVEGDNNQRQFSASESTGQTLRPTLVVRFETGGVGIAGAEPQAPAAARLAAARPNPFALSTTVDYELTRPGAVRLRVYDVRGRLVRELVDAVLPGGRHRSAWDGRDARGTRAASGVYFFRLESAGGVDAQKVVLRP